MGSIYNRNPNTWLYCRLYNCKHVFQLFQIKQKTKVMKKTIIIMGAMMLSAITYSQDDHSNQWTASAGGGVSNYKETYLGAEVGYQFKHWSTSFVFGEYKNNNTDDPTWKNLGDLQSDKNHFPVLEIGARFAYNVPVGKSYFKPYGTLLYSTMGGENYGNYNFVMPQLGVVYQQFILHNDKHDLDLYLKVNVDKSFQSRSGRTRASLSIMSYF